MQSHYNYIFDDITNIYNFTTKNDILYRVAFIIDETFSSISGKETPNIFQLIIEKAGDEAGSFDTRVPKTIEHIIERFIEKVENAFIYVCSDENKKAEARFKVFDRWYKNSPYKEKILKIDGIINIRINRFERQVLYTSFMFHKITQITKRWSKYMVRLNKP